MNVESVFMCERCQGERANDDRIDDKDADDDGDVNEESA
jgi:hypothetical protein